MKKTSVEVPFFVASVADHASVKNELINLISSSPSEEYRTAAESIGASDWTIPADVPRLYFPKIYEVLEPYIYGFMEEMQAKNIEIQNYWFQQYQHNDWHGWHVHPQTMYGMVYYIEMADDAPCTNLLVKNSASAPKVKEGDILFFPSILFHASPANNSTTRKTVFVANLSFSHYAGAIKP